MEKKNDLICVQWVVSHFKISPKNEKTPIILNPQIDIISANIDETSQRWICITIKGEHCKIVYQQECAKAGWTQKTRKETTMHFRTCPKKTAIWHKFWQIEELGRPPSGTTIRTWIMQPARQSNETLDRIATITWVIWNSPERDEQRSHYDHGCMERVCVWYHWRSLEQSYGTA
ncbi:hypothetical protein DM01DRAFT_1060479 [Hesseltinella vesiculosa]|uniref:Uncharacterized protein n=1 Tax=Hesseltinella vesiculosa TaxID=101127 RepID=A0A1X2GF23_9FUNG|nr:hypothetical protein DM01DRAFT_1060479 [Hesseltinella vesiculosa]